jgi:hypothetical protein
MGRVFINTQFTNGSKLLTIWRGLVEFNGVVGSRNVWFVSTLDTLTKACGESFKGSAAIAGTGVDMN